MITRRVFSGTTESNAIYSDCERYRYALTRVWEPTGPRLLYIMLNPSTATELRNDPTIERCERRARLLGYGGFRACNIFAWRDTSPADLRRAGEPVGPDNDQALHDGVAWATDLLCAWGVHGAHLNRGPQTETMLRATGRALSTLGLTMAGHPRHPLYVSYRQVLLPWPVPNTR